MPERKDARRNHAAILQAADVVFSEFGAKATTEAIAARAGVGIGTVFRHFPTKTKLITAVIENRVAALVDVAEALAAGSGTLFDLLPRLIYVIAEKQVLAQALTGQIADAVAADQRERLWRAIDCLLSRAQAGGQARPDLDATDLKALLAGAGAATAIIGTNPKRVERLIAMILVSLRPI